MSQKIQIRRGTDAARQTVIFDNGEPLWTTDTNQFYIGNGSTLGGVLAGGGIQGESVVTVQRGTTELENGQNLRNAYLTASGLTPNGKPINDNNRVCILIPPGTYHLPSGFPSATSNIGLQLTTPNIDLYGIGTPESVILKFDGSKGHSGLAISTSHAVLSISAEKVNIKNLTLFSIETGGWSIRSLVVGQNFSNFSLDNVILRYSGTNVNEANFTNGLLFIPSTNIGGKWNNIKAYGAFGSIKNVSLIGFLNSQFTNSIISGNSSFNLLDNITNVNFNSCKFYGDNLFNNIDSNWNNNKFSDCDFYGTGIFFNNAGASNNVIHNCRFYAPITGFEDSMTNCIINVDTTKPAITLLDNARLFNNTIICPNASSSISGNGVTAAIGFNTLDKPITGTITNSINSGYNAIF